MVVSVFCEGSIVSFFNYNNYTIIGCVVCYVDLCCASTIVDVILFVSKFESDIQSGDVAEIWMSQKKSKKVVSSIKKVDC